jgi:hypothetical protein
LNSGCAGGGRRHRRRDHLPAVPAADRENPIGREHRHVRLDLGHSHDAGIGDAGWNVAVFAHEIQDGIELNTQVESDLQRTSAQQLGNLVGTGLAEEVTLRHAPTPARE